MREAGQSKTWGLHCAGARSEAANAAAQRLSGSSGMPSQASLFLRLWLYRSHDLFSTAVGSGLYAVPELRWMPVSASINAVTSTLQGLPVQGGKEESGSLADPEIPCTCCGTFLVPPHTSPIHICLTLRAQHSASLGFLMSVHVQLRSAAVRAALLQAVPKTIQVHAD